MRLYGYCTHGRCCVCIQIDLLNENEKFEREIREEQEERKREEEEKKVRKAAFKEKATFFKQQMQ